MAPSQASPPRSKPPRRLSPKVQPWSAGSIKIPITGPACCATPATQSGSGSPAPARTATGARRRKDGRNASAPRLDPQTTRGNARPLAEGLARQRLEPLKEHLKGVNRLVVVNSPGLAGVPIEVLMAARPDPAWAGITVAYAPSASMFEYLVGRPTPRDRAPTLLALADPAYPETKKDTPAPTPPDAGLAIARVVPNGNADLNGIQAGDVLLTYAGTVLNQHADLKTVAPGAGPKKVPVSYWREGITREVEVAAGPLGVAIDDRPARAAVLARQAAERVLLGMRGGSRERLPGTRREVEAVARLFPAGMVTTVMGEQACESTVQDLARSGRMKAFRYLHFATHGESDPRNAYRAALILAPDPDRSADPLAFDSDGTITAEQIARTWELDADMVVLSACESGLGRAAGGEGYLGFAQPLFAKGARSLVLSLWKVDDDATALLMTRFYQNLLGTRAGLKSPLRKAEALAESKAWLRARGPRKSARPSPRSPAARSFTARRSRRSLRRPLRRPHVLGGLHPHRVPGLSKPRREGQLSTGHQPGPTGQPNQERVASHGGKPRRPHTDFEAVHLWKTASTTTRPALTQ